MKLYILTSNGKQVMRTKSYTRLYRKLESLLAGGLQYGIDLPTLNALGYQISVES